MLVILFINIVAEKSYLLSYGKRNFGKKLQKNDELMARTNFAKELVQRKKYRRNIHAVFCGSGNQKITLKQ